MSDVVRRATFFSRLCVRDITRKLRVRKRSLVFSFPFYLLGEYMSRYLVVIIAYRPNDFTETRH